MSYAGLKQLPNAPNYELKEVDDFYLWEFSQNTITKHSNFIAAPLSLFSSMGPAAEVERKQSVTKEATGRRQQLGDTEG